MSQSASNNTSETNSAAVSETRAALEELPDDMRGVLNQLVDQVYAATQRLHELEAENNALRERIQTLEQRPDVPKDALVITLEETTAEDLRPQLDQYINALDTALADLPPPLKERSATDASSS